MAIAAMIEVMNWIRGQLASVELQHQEEQEEEEEDVDDDCAGQ